MTDRIKTIGNKIRLMRVSKGLSQQSLAKEIGITQAHFSNIENGRCNATIDVLLRLHDSLGAPMAAFFEEIDEQEHTHAHIHNNHDDAEYHAHHRRNVRGTTGARFFIAAVQLVVIRIHSINS